MFFKSRSPLVITGWYAACGTLWIVVSDLLFSAVNISNHPWFNIAKGLAFILITSLVLFLLLLRYHKKQRQFETYLFKLFTTFPLPLCLYHFNKKKMLGVNTAFVNMFGYKVSTDITGHAFHKLAAPQEASSLEAFIQEHPQQSFDAGIREFKKSDGNPLFLQTSGYWLPFGKKGVVLLLGINMTEHINTLGVVAHQEYQLSNNQMILKDIAWLQSHQLRKPLANILGLAAMAAEYKQDELRAVLNNIYAQAKELDETVKMIVNKTYYSE